ncbi:MAG: hypothetical protein GXO82_01555 [Chlorobi bacterium]|nr:hypothetical protein [Chlorobiota bacterium]
MRATRYFFLFLFTIFCTNFSAYGQVTVPKGSYIIPMDNSGSHKCCQAKVLKAYGLVYDLNANKIPVQWAFSTTKSHGGVDFSVTDNQVKEYERIRRQ